MTLLQHGTFQVGIDAVHCLFFQITLPDGYGCNFCSFLQQDNGYAAEFRVAGVGDADGAREWLKQFQDVTKVTWRVRATKPESGRVNLCKTYYRCQHETTARKKSADDRPGSKNCRCPARLTIAVKRPQGKASK